MNRRAVFIVFKKELMDIIRDKKTLFSAILAPMLLLPILMILLSGGTEKMTKEIQENITIALLQQNATKEAQMFLEENIAKHNPNIVIVNPVEDAAAAIEKGTVKLVVDLDTDFEQKMQEGAPFSIQILYDDSRTRSGGSVGVLRSAIRDFEEGLVAQRLAALGVDTKILSPTLVEEKNVSSGNKGNFMLSMLLPLMIAMLMAIGGIPAATDLVAGEKERMTLEPLLTTHPSRMSILLGKYLTIILFSFASVASTVAGLFISFLLKPASITMGEGTLGGFSIPPLALALSIIITLLLGMTFSGIQLAISTYARSFKEAQTYLSFLIFIVMIPAYATMMLQTNDIQTYMFFVPILNTIVAFKMILSGSIQYTGLFISLVSSVVYVCLSLVGAAAMFRRESVLFRS